MLPFLRLILSMWIIEEHFNTAADIKTEKGAKRGERGPQKGGETKTNKLLGGTTTMERPTKQVFQVWLDSSSERPFCI